ncbi:MAG: translation initiation factor IF-5A [Candidatus Diapherotrites archaeon]|nr:translation initiation factor IF-5A [Candidatus Diapherotrites archaeon]
MAGKDAEKQFKEIGQVKEGSYILIDEHVCKVKEVEKSKSGKHGSTKARMTTIGLFDNQKRVLLKPTSADVEVPIVEKGSANVVAVMGGNIQIMDQESYETVDVLNPKDIPGIKAGDEVEFVRYGPLFKINRKK